MKKVIGWAALAGVAIAASAGSAQAQSISGSVTLTTDYVFRGLSLSNEDPAIQGSFDYETENFYAGAWGSSLGAGGSSMELDLYAGVTPQVGPIALDLGIIGYFYPGADDDGAEFDFFELAAAGSIDVTERFALGAGVNYSPENYGETGQSLYYELNAAFAPTRALAFNAALGSYTIDDVNGPLPVATDDTYTTWNVGGTLALHGFALDLRYHDTDISSGDAILAFIPQQLTDGRVVFSISRAL